MRSSTEHDIRDSNIFGDKPNPFGQPFASRTEQTTNVSPMRNFDFGPLGSTSSRPLNRNSTAGNVSRSPTFQQDFPFRASNSFNSLSTPRTHFFFEIWIFHVSFKDIHSLIAENRPWQYAIGGAHFNFRYTGSPADPTARCAKSSNSTGTVSVFDLVLKLFRHLSMIANLYFYIEIN